MYDIVKNVIISGDFRLSDMQTKIDTLWVQGDLTEDERNELIAIIFQSTSSSRSQTEWTRGSAAP